MDEFQNAQFGDRRLTRRLAHLAAAMAQQPDASLPAVTGSWGQACAAYRFLANPTVQPAALLAPHVARTLQRAAAHPVVLALNDTTTLNFATRPATTGLGPIGNHATAGFGLHLHSLFAVSPQRQPLGVLDAACWARDPAQFGVNHQRNRRPVAAKESAKWLASFQELQKLAAQTPQTRWVLVADREADLYELFALAQAAPRGPAVLVRVQHNRGVVDGTTRLFAHLEQLPVAGTLLVNVPRQARRPARTARLTVRFGMVQLRAPSLKAGRAALSLWALEARELHPPRGTAPLHWRLLSSTALTDWAAAVEQLGWYCARWGIEVFHKVLKSGCAVEAAQLQTAERLERYLMLKLVVAWRVMALTQAVQQQPAAAISEWLEAVEWRVLQAMARQDGRAAVAVSTVADAVHWLGRLGGHLGRRGDGPPGPLRIARGLQRLQDLTIGWYLAQITKGSA